MSMIRTSPIPSQNMFVHTILQHYYVDGQAGVLNPGGKPIHISTEKDRTKIPEISDLTVDMGLPAKAVKKKVRIGDMVVIQAPFTLVGKTVVAQALDNRVACWLALRAIRQLKEHDCEIHCAFTVQEEVGCRGAGPAGSRGAPQRPFDGSHPVSSVG